VPLFERHPQQHRREAHRRIGLALRSRDDGTWCAAGIRNCSQFRTYDFGGSSPIVASYQCTNANRNNIPAPISIAVTAAANKRPPTAHQEQTIAFAAKASAAISIASAYITTSNGKGVEFTACRRRGNVSAQLPSMTAITPLEIRQVIGTGAPTTSTAAAGSSRTSS